MAKSIDISDLDIYYGDFKAVEGVNMTIKAKAVTAFIGPSGCGKSTFLRSLNRMHEVIPGARVSGKVMVDGQSLYDAAIDPVEVRRRIGMVFQRPNPFPTMSIYENVLAGNRLNARRLARSEADAISRQSSMAAGVSTMAQIFVWSGASAFSRAASTACTSATEPIFGTTTAAGPALAAAAMSAACHSVSKQFTRMVTSRWP